LNELHRQLRPRTSNREIMAKATNQDVLRGIQNYFILPLLVFAMSSTLHGYLIGKLLLYGDKHNNDDGMCISRTDATINSSCTLNLLLNNGSSTSSEEFIQWVVSSRILLLGFPTQQALQHQIFESILSAVCWGACFLFIRKGCNPETRQGFFTKFWRGTCFSMLSIFNGSMLRAIVKGSIFPLGSFCTCFKMVISCSCSQLWSFIEQNDNEFICTSLYNACVVGICWGIGNTLVGRRINPAKLYPTATFIQRHWKDVSCGVLQMGTSNIIKALWKHYTQIELVEIQLANLFASLLAYTPLMATKLLRRMYLFTFGECQTTELQPYHHLYESIRVGLSWGFTSLFIRRGLNPDLRDGGKFVIKYWRDALFGAFALACCVFLKLATRRWLARLAALFVFNQTGPLTRDEL